MKGNFEEISNGRGTKLMIKNGQEPDMSLPFPEVTGTWDSFISVGEGGNEVVVQGEHERFEFPDFECMIRSLDKGLASRHEERVPFH